MASSAKLLKTLGLAGTAAALITMPIAAQAQTVVPFNGTIVASCILTVSTSGVLAMSTTGTEIGSEQIGGIAAVLGIVATGGAPTILFTAPSMSIRPAAYVGTPTVSLKYVSAGGANQAYTTAASQYTSTNPLGDTVTLNAKAVDSTGFRAGSYRLETTATCQQ
jgi:hypothetical protein